MKPFGIAFRWETILGLSSLLGHSYTGIKPATFSGLDVPVLSDIPILGVVLFQQDAIVYFSILAVIVVFIIFRNLRLGLILKAVGENHNSAHALGYNVILILIRFGAILVDIVPKTTQGVIAGHKKPLARVNVLIFLVLTSRPFTSPFINSTPFSVAFFFQT